MSRRAALLLILLSLALPARAEDTGGYDPLNAPFIPIPEVGTDPNSGTTLGLLTVFLSSEQGRIARIIAPDLIYNPQFGWGTNFRIFDYPSDDTQWSFVAGAKQKVERSVDGTYTTGILRQADWSLSTHLVYDRSGTGRFFGIGNASPTSAETNFTNRQYFLDTNIGRNFGQDLQVALELRPRHVQIQRGTLSALPSTDAVFPQLPGLGGEHDFLTRLSVAYDTRDSTTVPSRGTEIVGFAGFTKKGYASSVSYTRFGIDARHFEPINERFTLASHATLQYMPVGDDVPFWALSSLGGDRSVIGERQPLRGFGGDRFIDRNLFSTSVELRSKIFDLNLFTTDLTFEMAPFVDAGRVFHKLGDDPVTRLHVAGGLGLRAIAKPFIVGYVDVGYSSQGVAVFSGIDYPF